MVSRLFSLAVTSNHNVDDVQVRDHCLGCPGLLSFVSQQITGFISQQIYGPYLGVFSTSSSIFTAKEWLKRLHKPCVNREGRGRLEEGRNWSRKVRIPEKGRDRSRKVGIGREGSRSGRNRLRIDPFERGDRGGANGVEMVGNGQVMVKTRGFVDVGAVSNGTRVATRRCGALQVEGVALQMKQGPAGGKGLQVERWSRGLQVERCYSGRGLHYKWRGL